jgi:preprotein translocase subunit YajC
LSNLSIDVSSVNLFLGQAGMPAGAAPAAAPAATTTTVPAATTGAPATGQPVGGSATGGPGAMFLPLMMVGLLVFMIFISIMTGRKEKKRREALMTSLGKGDKVSTSAGIIGVITELTDSEVVIRSEDARIRLSKSAISGVLSHGGNKSSGTIEAKEERKAVGV